jgi:mannan endo-1,4-beta-mannosidase
MRLVPHLTAGLALLFASFSPVPTWAQPAEFVRVEDGRFFIGDQPYYFLGTNFWFGMNLGMAGEQGDRERLIRELDHLERLGLKNLRIMAATEGPHTEQWRVVPALQPEAGVYDEAVLGGLDFLLAEMARRDLRAVMVLNNFFMWSGGMAQYVSWATGEPIPYPNQPGNTWDDFQHFSARFFGTPGALDLFDDFVRMILARTNSITGVAYVDDPTIMSWQLANEPRGFDHSEEYVAWVDRAGAIIREAAPRQLISLGGEGKLNPDWERTQFERVSRSPYLDYLTIHIWIENWAWYDPRRPETFNRSVGRTMGYIADHVAIAEQLRKPIVLEEFGVTRDGRDYDPHSPVTFRDTYFEMVFEAIHHLARHGSTMAGSNIWSWSGEGLPVEPGEFWNIGDPFTGDPPHEEQGWYSVYEHDESTLEILARYARMMEELSQTMPRAAASR